MAAAACSTPRETAPPVATPSVQLAKSDAPVGGPVDITYRFAVAADAPSFSEDYTVFVHFMDDQGGRLWTDDHLPPVPTRQWQPGQTVEYQRTIFVPKSPYTGPARIEIGLYSPQSGERLPLAGDDTGMRAYRVADFELVRPADDVFVVFKDGWHGAEVSEDGTLDWQWSRREGTFTFRNPRRAAELFLDVDQPAALSEPQQIEVRLGGNILDTFSLAAGQHELRRIALSPEVLGDAETVEVTVAADPTFVPADVPALRSSDARELGVRVFRVYVEPE